MFQGKKNIASLIVSLLFCGFFLDVHCTGGTGGMGQELAKYLLGRNYNVTMTAKDLKKGKQVAKELTAFSRARKGGDVTCLELDMSNLNSVRKFGKKYFNAGKRNGGVQCEVGGQGHGAPLNLISFNAGVMNGPYEMCPNPNPKDANDLYPLESHYQINHLSSMLLLHYLLPSMFNEQHQHLEKRVLMTGSRMHARQTTPIDVGQDVQRVTREQYNGWRAFQQSALANIQATRRMARYVKCLKNLKC